VDKKEILDNPCPKISEKSKKIIQEKYNDSQPVYMRLYAKTKSKGEIIR